MQICRENFRVLFKSFLCSKNNFESEPLNTMIKLKPMLNSYFFPGGEGNTDFYFICFANSFSGSREICP